MQKCLQAFRMLISMIILTGCIYPLVITVIAMGTMSRQANGGIIVIQDKTVGADLIGQKFSQDQYFWGRPSATDNSALPSGGSNLSQTSTALKQLVNDRRILISQKHSANANQIPAELLYASGSGLDPHISPATAEFQIERISKVRKISSEKLQQLVQEHVQKPVLGPKVVNVLRLNLAVDEMTEK